MRIKILGSGCDKCHKLAQNAEDAVRQINADCEIEKVTDINKILDYGVLITPAFVLDEKLICSGKVLKVDEISELLKNADGFKLKTEAPQKEETEGACSCCSCSSGDDSDSKQTQCTCSKAFKKIITLLLLIFVGITLIVVIGRENKAPASPDATKQSISSSTLTVYYFHGNKRCVTCNKIEAMTKALIASKFQKELKSGEIVFRSVNLDEKANEHFVKDFQLDSRIVVIAKGNKTEKLPSVWDFNGDETKFNKYIEDAILKIKNETSKENK